MSLIRTVLEGLGIAITPEVEALIAAGATAVDIYEAIKGDATSPAQEDTEPTTPPRKRPKLRSDGPATPGSVQPPTRPPRQRRIGLVPSTEKSQLNSHSYGKMSGARYATTNMDTRKTSPNDGEEVNVVPPPPKVAKVIADYTTIRLPWHHREMIEMTNGNWNAVRLINMNSPSNPSANFISHYPMGWTNWTANYEFYRVLGAEIHIETRYVYGIHTKALSDFKLATASNNSGCFSCMVGYELTEDGAKVYQNAFQMIEGKHSTVKWLDPKDVELLGDRKADANISTQVLLTAGGRQTLDFHYQPENWDTHVHETGVSSRWTAVANVSDVQHYLAYHAMTPGDVNDRIPSGDSILLRVDMNVNYIVQFREALETMFTRNTATI